MKTYGVEYDSPFYKSASALVNYGFRFPVISLPGTIRMYYPLNDYPEVNDAFDEGLISGYTIFRPPIPFREGETPGFVLTYDKCDAERLVAIAPKLFALSTLEVLAEWDAKGCGLAGIDDDPDMKEHWQRVINTARLLP